MSSPSAATWTTSEVVWMCAGFGLIGLGLGGLLWFLLVTA